MKQQGEICKIYNQKWVFIFVLNFLQCFIFINPKSLETKLFMLSILIIPLLHKPYIFAFTMFRHFPDSHLILIIFIYEIIKQLSFFSILHSEFITFFFNNFEISITVLLQIFMLRLVGKQLFIPHNLLSEITKFDNNFNNNK